MNSRAVAIMVILGAVGAIPLQGQQVAVGLKGGVNFADVLGDGVGPADFRTGFVGGGHLAYMVTESFHIQVEGLFTQKGAEFDGRDGDVELKLSYVEIPLLAKMVFADRRDGRSAPYLFAGPALAIEIDCEVEVSPRGEPSRTLPCDNASFDGTRSTEDWDLGLLVGGGVDVAFEGGSFQLEGRADYGLRSIDASAASSDIRNTVLTVMAGISFNLGG